MYDLQDYARMIADEARMGPYVRALQAVVHSGSVVADVGSGTGIFALVACRLGARRVYAIETNDAIDVARDLARENGFADRIVFFHSDARSVDLPERADVLVSDLRGSLPLFGDHLAVIADVRERFLKPGGVLVPERDRLMVAVVSDSGVYARAIGPADGPLGLSLTSMRARLVNASYTDKGSPRALRRPAFVSDAFPWVTLEYASVQPNPVRGHAVLRIERESIGHGLAVWFETSLIGEHGFSSATEELESYGRLFLPWPRPVALARGDLVTVDLWAQPGGDPWGWTSSVPIGAGMRESFKQSSFLSNSIRPSAARARGFGDPGLSPTIQT